MANVEVIEVETQSQLRDFINYPNRLYKGDPNYVAPLTMERKEFFDKEKNPFYRKARTKLFLAKRDGQTVGRIATCINFAHNDYHDEQIGFFGFFDCPDDYEIAQPLFKVAMITLKKEGAETMRGPANFSTNHEVGFLVEGFDTPPTIMMTYNKPYLPRLAEKFGLKKEMDLLAFTLTKAEPIPERIANVVEKIQKRSKITIRNIRMSEFQAEVDRINDVYNQAWEKNWGFVPMDKTEFDHMAKSMKQIVDPDLVFIAEHEGKMVAFLLALPNINQALKYLNGRLLPFGLAKLLWHTKIRNKVDGVRVLTMGVIPQYQKRGIDNMLYVNVYNNGTAKGYNWAEMSWILETNDLMCSAAKEMNGRLTKRYRMVEMPI